jgi:hypothetical protein
MEKIEINYCESRERDTIYGLKLLGEPFVLCNSIVMEDSAK